MEFFAATEKDLIENRYSPLNVVFVLVHDSKGYMLLQNRESNFFELPAGAINPDETHKQCAIRRCKETSGQNAVDLKLIGICKMVFEHRETPDHFAIYEAKLDYELPFAENDETKALIWYKPGQEIDKFCNTCSNVIKFYESRKTFSI